jgi:hypothetical protein
MHRRFLSGMRMIYRVGVRRRRTGDRVYPEQRRVRAHEIEVRSPIAENGGGTGH